MGYTTDFTGAFKLDKPLSVAQLNYLRTFSDTRRMKRNQFVLESKPDPVRLAVGLPIGEEGGYYVGSPEDGGQMRTDDILEYNQPPIGQPGLWCKWEPTEDGTAIQWSGAEKFYSYVEWLDYLITHFLKPWGLSLTGDVEWSGESQGDIGIISVNDNVITIKKGKIIYE